MNRNRASIRRLAYVGKKPGVRDSDSWFTPTKYLVAVREVLGRIDLDPFSSDVANMEVQARHHYTERDDAFKQSWLANSVFMNPPYGKMCRRAVEKCVEEFRNWSFQNAVVLVNNATETTFFQLLLNAGSAVCFTDHRISFYNSDGKSVSGNTRGQAFFYLSQNPDIALFRKVFSPFGKVLPCK